MKLRMVVGLGPGHTVLDGDPVAPLERGTVSPPFLTQVYCGHTAGWIKMSLGTKVGLGPGDIALDVDPAPHPEMDTAHRSPTFWPVIVAKRLGGSGYHLVRR